MVIKSDDCFKAVYGTIARTFYEGCIVYDTETKVMYCLTNYGMSPLYNADGSLKLYCKDGERMDELKACPFCGSKNVGVRDYPDPMIYYHFVICKECNAKTGNFGTKEKAIEAWNRRVDDD